MLKNYYFPTVISSEINIAMMQQMLPVAHKYLADEQLLTWTWGYKNTFTTAPGLEQFDDMQPFIDYVQTNAYAYLDSCGYDSDKIEFGLQLFVSEMQHGDQHACHTHPNSLLSGVFYLEVPLGSSPIKFHDPRTFYRSVTLPVKQDCLENWQNCWVKPEPGLFLIWPSWLEHEVPKNLSEQARTTIVFNLSWGPRSYV